jgi:hypothetical protein
VAKPSSTMSSCCSANSYVVQCPTCFCRSITLPDTATIANNGSADTAAYRITNSSTNSLANFLTDATSDNAVSCNT